MRVKSIYTDLETTGLLLPQIAPLDRQPYAVEICILDDEGNEFYTLIKPPIPIPPEVVRVHGINDEMVKDAPTFKDIAHEVAARLDRAAVHAYNASFDSNILRVEFKRLGKMMPLCSWIDPMHWAQLDTGKRWKQADLHAALTGEKVVKAHSARHDTHALKTICDKLAERKK